jgi:hypothetical protein
MTKRDDIRETVRVRAQFAGEYCGVHETHSGDLLTIDHFQPVGKGGDDNLGNLVYCCMRCNQYKGDYWPDARTAPTLWNPRRESAVEHVIELDDGRLAASTQAGAFSINLLHLNRPALVAYRQNRRKALIDANWLERYRQLVVVLDQLVEQQAQVIAEQKALLAEQRQLLQRLLQRLD